MPQADDNHAKFMQLFLRYQPRLYAMIRAQIVNRGDAEDVMQEVATVLWREFEEYQPGTHFDRWAFRIARLQTLKYFEKRRHHRLVFDAEVMEMISEEVETANETLDDTREALEHCLGKLPEKDRTIVKLRYEPGATNRSVAEHVGKSDSAISRSLNRIYGLLLNCIQSQMTPRSAGGGR